MKTPSYRFGYIYVNLIRLFAVLVLLSGIGIAYSIWMNAEISARSLRYEAPSAFLEKYNQLALMMKVNYDFIMMLNNQAAIPDDYSEAKRYLAQIEQRDWGTSDFDRFEENLKQAGVANRTLKEYLLADYTQVIRKFTSELKAKIELARQKLTPPAPVNGSSHAATNQKPMKRELRNYPVAPFYENDKDRDRSIRTLSDAGGMVETISDQLESLDIDGVKEMEVGSISQARDYINMFQQILGMALSVIWEDIEKEDISLINKSEEEIAYIRQLRVYREKLRQLEQLDVMVSNIETKLIIDIHRVMKSDWKTDQLIESLLNTIDSERQRIVNIDRERSQILSERWLKSGIPLMVSMLIAFILFVSADFLIALLDTAKHTGIVAEYYTEPRPPE